MKAGSSEAACAAGYGRALYPYASELMVNKIAALVGSIGKQLAGRFDGVFVAIDG